MQIESGSQTRRLIMVLVIVLITVPVLLDLGLSGERAAFRYLAPDAFYYHVVARNIAEFGSISYDGVHPTNGFHPLWQAALAALYALVRGLHLKEIAYLSGSVVVGIVAVAAGIWLLMDALIRSHRPLPAWWVALPVGAYALVLVPYWVLAVDVKSLVQRSQGPFPLFGTLWSYANGMESGLVLLVFGGLARAYVTSHGRMRTVSIGLLGAALVLARLDHLLIAVFLLLPFARRAWYERSIARVRDLGVMSACLILPLIGYLILNQVYSGMWLPISGSIKTTFPHVTAANLQNLRMVLLQPFDGPLAVSRMYRAAQILFPILAALFLLWQSARQHPSMAGERVHDLYGEFLRLTAAGVIALGSYDFLFVDPFATGHWYTPVSVLFVSLVVLETAGQAQGRRPISLVHVLLWFTLSLVVFWTLQRRPTYHWRYADFYFVEGPAARAAYGEAVPHLVEYDDGIIAFGTHFPAMSGTGLELDKEAGAARRAGHFDELALQRGYDRAACITYCLPAPTELPPYSDLGPAGAAASMAIFEKGHPGESCSPEYVSSTGNFWILRCQSEAAAP